MKKVIFFLATIVALFSCKNSEKSPIWDRKPVDTTFAMNFPLEEFHKLGETNDTIAQKAMVNKYRRQLTINIMSHYPCVTNEKNIRFIFGSGKVKNILSGDGKTYDGKFKNELIIIVNDPCTKDTVFLACGNGMLSPINFNSYSDWGNAEKCKFVVEKGQSIAYFLPKLEDWGVKANELGLPIVDRKGRKITQKVYMERLGKWWSDHLFTGDVIDLCNKIITDSSGKKVDFEKRILETKKTKKPKSFKKRRRK